MGRVLFGGFGNFLSGFLRNFLDFSRVFGGFGELALVFASFVASLFLKALFCRRFSR